MSDTANPAYRADCLPVDANDTGAVQREIYWEDIQMPNATLGHRVLRSKASRTEEDMPLMVGKFNVHEFDNGLTIHINKAVEELDACCSAELPPGLSMNFVFAGLIDFCFAGQQYQIGHEGVSESALCSTIINNCDEVLTRHTRKGMLVMKLNIFVEKDWLMRRCKSPANHRMLAQLFHKQQVFQWQPDSSALDMAHKIVRLHAAESLLDKLEIEQLTLHLLSIGLGHAVKQTTIQVQPLAKPEITGKELSLLKCLDQYADGRLSTQEIAQAMNMSLSTLQRKFKQRYGIAVSSYLKQRRLELAKKWLVVDHLSVNEVAYRIGYRHPSNFINAFKNALGITPAGYVKKHHARAASEN